MKIPFTVLDANPRRNVEYMPARFRAKMAREGKVILRRTLRRTGRDYKYYGHEDWLKKIVDALCDATGVIRFDRPIPDFCVEGPPPWFTRSRCHDHELAVLARWFDWEKLKSRVAMKIRQGELAAVRAVRTLDETCQYIYCIHAGLEYFNYEQLDESRTRRVVGVLGLYRNFNYARFRERNPFYPFRPYYGCESTMASTPCSSYHPSLISELYLIREHNRIEDDSNFRAVRYSMSNTELAS